MNCRSRAKITKRRDDEADEISGNLKARQRRLGVGDLLGEGEMTT